jgi:hypothetical protein
MQSVKRRLAVDLGVDPYSTNEILQKDLDSVAWASFAGGTTLSVLLLPVGGGVVTAAKVASLGDDLQQILRESSPADLRKSNGEKLAGMEVPRKQAEAFLDNAAISPSRETAIVTALAKLDGVKGRDGFVRAAAENSEHEEDAVFWHLTAKMIADLHAGGTRIDRLVLLEGGFPVALARDGTVVVALHWDYACWTELASRMTDAILTLGSGDRPRFVLTISGSASPRLRKELESRGFQVSDRAVPGPLK